ncbi:MAG: TonB-dependent receptor plug domain-containing protein, partial [Parvularculaceae bacterium]|nr:TonB-dependent receptor plug domain-containing protein [Parvularculaceae bacterium]
MKTSAKVIKLGLLAATMLSAPGVALAQTPPPPPAEPAAESEPTEILVLGKNIPEPQRDTSEVVTVLTAEDLARTGDDNAAAALTRLSGLSVISGKFVFVRGLGDRYSQALLNGSPLPSPEPLRRTVPLDLFPSNILEGAIVQKTFSPDYPGEFGGGVINLQTLKTPEKPFLSVGLGTGANLVSTGKDGLVYEGTNRDWTTFGGGLRDIPAPLQSAINSGKFINGTNFTPGELQTIGRS